MQLSRVWVGCNIVEVWGAGAPVNMAPPSDTTAYFRLRIHLASLPPPAATVARGSSASIHTRSSPGCSEGGARRRACRVGWVANRRWVGGRSTAECARDERARARQRAFSHQTMSIHPPCSCAPARPPAVPSVPVTVRAPFEDQPCHRGTKRNNRQIKVGQSARSLRVAQLSKRAC